MIKPTTPLGQSIRDALDTAWGKVGSNDVEAYRNELAASIGDTVSVHTDAVVVSAGGVSDAYLKNREYALNILDFGAHATSEPGYGSFDNSAALQAAIAAAGTKSYVYIPPGTFQYGTTLTYAMALRIFGSGRGTSALQYTGAGVGMTNPSSGTRVYNLDFRDFWLLTSTGTVGLDLDSVSMGEFSNVLITGWSDCGVSLHSTNGGGSVYNRFYNVRSSCATGFKLRSIASNANVFVSCRANGCTTRGWDIQDCNDNTIFGCQAEACGVGVYLAAPLGAGITLGNRIVTSRFENNTTGLEVADANVLDTVESGNHYAGNGVDRTINSAAKMRNTGQFMYRQGGAVFVDSGVNFFSGGVIATGGTSAFLGGTSNPARMMGNIATSATAVGVHLGNFNALTTDGSRITSFHAGPTNVTTNVVASIDNKGNYLFMSADALEAGQYRGTGSPEGVQSAPVGSTYLRLDGAAGSSFYSKVSGGTGNTGWSALVDGARTINGKPLSADVTLTAGDLGASVGGSTTQIQFNDAGAFSGSALFTFNKTTGTATLGASSGADAIKFGVNGARLHLGTGTSDYLYSDGFNIYFAATALSSGNFQAQSGGFVGGGGASATVRGTPADGAAAVSVKIASTNALSTAGAKIVSFYNDNGTTEKAYIDKDGHIRTGGYFIGLGGAVLRGSVADGVSAVALRFGNATDLATPGAKIASFYSDNLTTEKAFIDKDGSTVVAGAYIGSTSGPAFLSNSGAAWVKGTQADGATAVGTIIDTSASYATAGAKIASFRTSTVEKAYINKDGAGYFLGAVYGSSFLNPGLSTTYVQGRAPDGASAVGVILDTTTNLVTAGARIVSFQNAGVEKAYIGRDGLIQGSAGFSTSATVYATGGFQAGGTNAAILRGTIADGTTAIAAKITNTNALSASGAKIVSFYNDNGTTEKAFIDSNGYIVSLGGIIYASTFAPFITASLSLTGRAADASSAVGVRVGNVNALATAGAKIVSFFSDNMVTEKAYIDLNGLLYAANFRALGANPVYLVGGSADSASAVGAAIDNTTALVTAGAKLLSLRNGGVEKAWFDLGGNLTAPGASIARIDSTGGSNGFKLTGWASDSGTGVGVVIDNGTALTVSGGKLLSIRNSTVEKAYVTYAGDVVANNNLATAAGIVYSGNNTLTLRGGAVDSAAAVGVSLNTSNAYSTVGSKLVSIQNNGIEKASFDYNGNLFSNTLYANALDRSSAGYITIGGTTATGITLGRAAHLPVQLAGALDAPGDRYWQSIQLTDAYTLIWNNAIAQDHFQFRAPTSYETTTDGTNWSAGTLTNNIFMGDVTGSFTVAYNSCQAFRMTWDGASFGYRWFDLLYMAASYNGHPFTVTLQTSPDGVTWTPEFTTATFQQWPGHMSYRKYINNSGKQWLRLLFTPAWNASFPSNPIYLYNLRLFGGYPTSGAIKPFFWDYNRNLTVGGNVYSYSKFDVSSALPMYVGDTTATGITVGKSTITTTFPGLISSTAAASTDAIKFSTAGARLHLGPGSTDYLNSDGNTRVTAAGDFATVGKLIPGADSNDYIRGGSTLGLDFTSFWGIDFYGLNRGVNPAQRASPADGSVTMWGSTYATNTYPVMNLRLMNGFAANDALRIQTWSSTDPGAGTATTVASFDGTGKLTSNVGSGADAIKFSTSGARLHLGAGSTDYLYSDGTDVYAGGNFIAGGSYATAFYARTATSAIMSGRVADGASAVANILNNSAALSTAGAKLLSVQNNGVEKASVNKDGAFKGYSYIADSGEFDVASTVRALLHSRVADGATAVAFTLNAENALSTAGAKLLSLMNNGVEKASVDKDGNLTAGSVYSNDFAAYSTATATVRGRMLDGASAVAVILNSGSTYSTAGAKLLSVRNNGTEKLYVDLNGGLRSFSYITADGNINGSTVYSSGGTFGAGNANTSAILYGNINDAANAVGAKVNNAVALTAAGARILSLQNASVEKAAFDKDGGLSIAGVASGSDAIKLAVTGQRLHLGAGTNDYLYSDGTKILSASAIEVGGDITSLGTRAVLESRTINGYDLSANRTLTAGDVGAQLADNDLTAIAALTGTGWLQRTGVDTWSLGTPGAGYDAVQDEGVTLTARATMNFVGALVTAVDDAANARTNVTIATPRIDQASNPTGDTTWTFPTGKKMLWTFTGSTDEAFTIHGDGAFVGTGDLVHIHKSGTGAAVGADALHVEVDTDTNMTGLRVTMPGATADAVNTNAKITAAGGFFGNITTDAISGANAITMTSGSRIKLGAGANEILYSDGTYVRTAQAMYASGYVGASMLPGSAVSLSLNGRIAAAQGAAAGATGLKFGAFTALSGLDRIAGFYPNSTGTGEVAVVDANGTFTSLAASGNNAFAASTNGARWKIGAGTNDYFSSDGTTITTPAVFQVGSAGTGTIFAGSIVPNSSTGTLALAGKGTDSATVIAVKMYSSTGIATAGGKIVAFYPNSTVTGGGVAWIDKDGTGSFANVQGGHATPTYSTSITPDATGGWVQTITVTNGTAFTVNAPTNPKTGERLTLRVKNTSGGAIGVITWNAVFKMATFTNPANGFSQAVTFFYDGTNWVETHRTSSDIPN